MGKTWVGFFMRKAGKKDELSKFLANHCVPMYNKHRRRNARVQTHTGGKERLKMSCNFAGFSSHAEKLPENELLAFRQGGTMYLDWHSLGEAAAIELPKGRVAEGCALQLREYFGASMKTFLAEKGSAVRCVALSYTEKEVLFTIDFSDFSRPAQCLRYTYNEYLDAERLPTYTASEEDRQRMRRAALSRLVELMPKAYMHNGKIYQDADHYRLYK